MKKDIPIVFALVLLVAVFIMGTDFQTVDEYYLTHINDITPESETVSLSINCQSVLDNYDKLDKSLKDGEYIPSDGIILAETEYVLRDGDTVFDILHRAVRYNKIQFEYQGAEKNSFGSAYVQGIGYLYEYSCGETSGWVYTVNGEFPKCGCSKYELKDGDRVEWIYTCDLGQNSEYFNNMKGDTQ